MEMGGESSKNLQLGPLLFGAKTNDLSPVKFALNETNTYLPILDENSGVAVIGIGKQKFVCLEFKQHSSHLLYVVWIVFCLLPGFRKLSTTSSTDCKETLY